MTSARKYLFRGRLRTCNEIAAMTGVNRSLIDKRMRRGDSIDQAARVVRRKPEADYSIDVEEHIEKHPDGMTCDQIAKVFGVTEQAINLISKSAAAKIRRMRISEELCGYLADAYNRAPGHWQSAWDGEADLNGVSRVPPLYNHVRPLSAAAAEPSELTARVDAAIAHLEVAADRALLAALSQVRLQES